MNTHSPQIETMIAGQIRRAKIEFRQFGHVQPATISSWFSSERWDAIRKRHDRFVNYIRNVKPGWKSAGMSSFADGSTTERQIDINGNERVIFLTMPHGDCSF